MPRAWLWRSAAVALVGAGQASALHAQRVTEVGVHATLLAADPAVWVGGVYGAVRPSSRVRVAALVGAGMSDDAFAWRSELLWQFLLTPRARRGVGAYGGGGIAVTGGSETEGFVVLILGLEARPGAGSGWAFEAGVGGGLRLSASYRWRRVRGQYAPGG